MSSTPEDLLSVLDRVSPSLKARVIDAEAQAVLAEESSLHAILNSLIETDQSAYAKYIRGMVLLRQAIGLSDSEMGLIVNGRVSLPYSSDSRTSFTRIG